MSSIYSRAQALAGAVVAVVSFILLSTVDAGRIPAGYDYFETVQSGTYIDFSYHPTPRDFFDPDSDPFAGTVPLRGIPLDPATLGTTDTIVQRLSDINITQRGEPLTVPIEIVALNLVSANPITVTYNGGQNPELWNVRVSLPTNQQQPGSMTIIQTSSQGGTYSSTLSVQPILSFTRISDGEMRTLRPQMQFTAAEVPWSYKADRALLTDRRFCPSCHLTGAPVEHTSIWQNPLWGQQATQPGSLP